MSVHALLESFARELGVIRERLSKVPAVGYGTVTVVVLGPPVLVDVDLGGGKIAERLRCASRYAAAPPVVDDHVFVIHHGSGRSLVIDAVVGA